MTKSEKFLGFTNKLKALGEKDTTQKDPVALYNNLILSVGEDFNRRTKLKKFIYYNVKYVKYSSEIILWAQKRT